MEYFSAANNTQAENTNNDQFNDKIWQKNEFIITSWCQHTKAFFQDKNINYLVLIFFRNKLECFVTDIKVKLVHVILFEMSLLKCSTLMITLKP